MQHTLVGKPKLIISSEEIGSQALWHIRYTGDVCLDLNLKFRLIAWCVSCIQML